MTAKPWKNKALFPGQARRVRLAKAGVIFLICLCSFWYALYCAETIGKYSTQYTHDEGNYIAMAQRLLSEHWYGYWGTRPDAYVSPGYPLFLTLCMALFGTGLEGIFWIKVVQCVLVAGTVLLTYLLGRLLTGQYRVGLVSCLLVAGTPSFAVYSRLLLTETLYFFTMMLFFVVFALAMQRDKRWLYGAAGCCFAVTILVRPLLSVILPVLFLPLLARSGKQWRRWLLPVLLFLAGFVVVCLPWWVRNCVTLGKFIPLATQTNPIYAGLAPDVAALGLEDPGSMLGNLRLLLRLLRQDFWGTAYWMTFGKFRIIFMDEVSTYHARAATIFLRNLVVFLGLFGGIRAFFVKNGWGPALVFWVYLASSFLFIPVSRYSLQYIPLLAILAALLLDSAFARTGWGRPVWLPSRATPGGGKPPEMPGPPDEKG